MPRMKPPYGSLDSTLQRNLPTVEKTRENSLRIRMQRLRAGRILQDDEVPTHVHECHDADKRKRTPATAEKSFSTWISATVVSPARPARITIVARKRLIIRDGRFRFRSPPEEEFLTTRIKVFLPFLTNLHRCGTARRASPRR